MAQVYSFVDENGQTRLLAEIHPDPAGTPFNGGTITNPLTVLETDGTSKGIVVNTQGGFGVNALEIDAPHTTLTIDGDGVVALSSDDTLGVTFTGDAGTAASLNVIGHSGTQAAEVSSADGFVYLDTALRASAVAQIAQLFMFAYHAAPADGALVAGDCALWFDQTNGAAKLMVKAKQADGTVRTGSLALT